MADKKKPAEYEAKLRVKKGDEVMVIAGKDRGKQGKVLRAFPKVNKVMVEGLNIVIRHTKARQTGRTGRSGVQQMQDGGRIHKPAPMSAAKVMVMCKSCNKPTRIGYEYREGTEKLSSRKYRVCKHPECAKPID